MTKKKLNKEEKIDALVSDIGKRIRQARDDAGLTQAELAEKIDRRQASISDMENSKMEPSAGTLARLALALEKPISYFFPVWILKRVKPEDLSPAEEELLGFARQLSKDDLERILIQVRALAKRDEMKYYQWLEEDASRE